GLAAQLLKLGARRGRLGARGERGADHVVGGDEQLGVAERLVLEARFRLAAALVRDVEAQAARADLYLVAVAQGVLAALLAVDDEVRAALRLDVGVVARGARVVEDDAVVGRAPDGARALRRERQLPFAPAGVRDVQKGHTRESLQRPWNLRRKILHAKMSKG